jgi:6-pyruvoyltetrahydropterin/6-carboxytetrahydropterin synthase
VDSNSASKEIGLVQVTRRFEFSAAHRYWRDDWSREQNERTFGKCTSPYGHGHNYTLDVTITGATDPVTGMVMNITELKAIVGGVLESFDHKHLNEDTPYFRDRIPTTEEIVRVLWELIGPLLPPAISLARLRLAETNDLWAEYAGAPEIGRFTRSYTFAAAHRLHAPSLSDAENQLIYGKCNNPNGHGHNYTVEVSVQGLIDRQTGMVIDLVELDRVVRDVLDQLDFHHLDREVEAFAEHPSTGEHIVVFLWDALLPQLAGRLVHLRLWETNRNLFDYAGPALLAETREFS